MSMTMNRTAIEGPDAEIAKEHLQASLVDLLDLTLQAKQAHWNVVGERFRSLHLQLDELVELTRGFTDTIAERIVTLGEPAQGSARTIDHQSKVDPFPTSFVKDTEVVEHFVERLNGVCARLRQNVSVLDERDPVSHDLLVECLGALEQQMWMFHAQVQ